MEGLHSSMNFGGPVTGWAGYREGVCHVKYPSHFALHLDQ